MPFYSRVINGDAHVLLKAHIVFSVAVVLVAVIAVMGGEGG